MIYSYQPNYNTWRYNSSTKSSHMRSVRIQDSKSPSNNFKLELCTYLLWPGKTEENSKPTKPSVVDNITQQHWRQWRKNIRNLGRKFAQPLPVEIKSFRFGKNLSVRGILQSFYFYLHYEFPIWKVPDELEWYPYVSLFPDLLCKIGLSVSGLRKMRFNAYTPRQISTKKSSQRNQDSRCPRW